MKGNFILAAMAVGGIVFYLSGCAKESADRLSGGSTCDTTNVSYSKQVLPILQDNCYSCHNQGAASSDGIELSDFTVLQAHVANGDIVSAVTHNGKVTPMPFQLPQLPSCEVNTIVAWVDQGALNN
jgi:hypothetical protein